MHISYFDHYSLLKLIHETLGAQQARCLNKDWTPPLQHKVHNSSLHRIKEQKAVALSPRLAKVFIVLGALSVCAWFLTTPLQVDQLPLHVERWEALELAKSSLLQSCYNSDKIQNVTQYWKVIAVVNGYDWNAESVYVWQTEEQQFYEKEMRIGYLQIPHWKVKFLQFSGEEVSKRAEGYTVLIRDNSASEGHEKNRGAVFRVIHEVPEADAGEQLTREQAEKEVLDFIQVLGYTQDGVNLISADSYRKPNRLDWKFIFSDTKNTLSSSGENRIAVKVSGNMVTDWKRYVFVPEDWRRQFQSSKYVLEKIQVICTTLVSLIFAVFVFAALVNWSVRGHFNLSAFKSCYLYFFALLVLSLANEWPQVYENKLNTSEPLINQTLVLLGMMFLRVLTIPFGVSILVGFIHHFRNHVRVRDPIQPLVGLSLGFVWSGTLSFLRQTVLRYMEAGNSVPQCESLVALSSYFPVFGVISAAIKTFITTSVVFFLITILCDKLSDCCSRGRACRGLILFFAFQVLGFISEGASQELSGVAEWLVNSIAFGAIGLVAYLNVWQYDRSLIPLFASGLTLLDDLKRGLWYDLFPAAGARIGHVGGSLSVLCLAYLWTRTLRRNNNTNTTNNNNNNNNNINNNGPPSSSGGGGVAKKKKNP